MLETIRRFTGTWVAKVVFGLLALSFGVFFGMADMTRQMGMKNYVAIVGGEKVSIKDFQRTLYHESERIGRFMGKRLTFEELKNLEIDKYVLNKLINQTLIDLEVRRMNIVISDDRVREECYKQNAFKNKDGLFDRQLFLRIVQAQGYSEAEFIESIRRDIATKLLFGTIVSGIKVDSTFANTMYDYHFRPREVRVVKLPFSAVSVPAIDAKALDAFYALHKEEFVKPEYRKLVYYVLSKDKLEKSREIEDQLAAGKSLKEIHKEFGLSPVTVDFVSKTGLSQHDKKMTGMAEDPAFLDVAYATHDQEDSMLFELANGDWCALHVEKVLPSRVPSFEEIKDHVATRAKFDQQKQQAEQTVRDTVEALKEKKETLETFAKHYKQEVVTHKNIIRTSEDEKKAPFSNPALSKILSIKYGSFGFVVAEDHALVVSVPKPLARDEAKKKKVFEELSNDVAGGIGNDIILAYLSNLEKTYGVEKVLNEK